MKQSPLRSFAAVLSVLLLAGFPITASGQASVVVVPGNSPDFNTGIGIIQGQPLSIFAEGVIDNGNGPWPPAGRAGSVAGGAFTLPGAREFCLLARIGNGPWMALTALPSTNAGFNAYAWATGELHLAVNDDFHGDNGGAFTVRVRLIPEIVVQAADGSGVATGLTVAAGTPITIVGTGSCNNGNGSFGPAGNGLPAGGGFKLPNAPEFSLIGRVGAGGWFYVGPLFVGAAPAGGQLVLAFNDDFYGDNADEWECFCAVGGGAAAPVIYGMFGAPTGVPWSLEFAPPGGPILYGGAYANDAACLLGTPVGAGVAGLAVDLSERVAAVPWPFYPTPFAAPVPPVLPLGLAMAVTIPAGLDLWVSAPGVAGPPAFDVTAAGPLGPGLIGGVNFNPTIGVCATQNANCGGIFSAPPTPTAPALGWPAAVLLLLLLTSLAAMRRT